MDSTLYWDNKTLPTPTLTLTLPDILFSIFLIISFIFIENKCFSDVIWKREKKSLQKSGFEPGLISSKWVQQTFCHLSHWRWQLF